MLGVPILPETCGNYSEYDKLTKNIAMNGIASQSSVSETYIASNALKKSKWEYNKAMTDYETNPWWKLDLHKNERK